MPSYDGKTRSLDEIVPDLGSYIADVEQNLREDKEAFAEYTHDPTAVLTDLAMDFGNFSPDRSDEDIYAEVEMAVEDHLHPRTRIHITL